MEVQSEVGRATCLEPALPPWSPSDGSRDAGLASVGVPSSPPPPRASHLWVAPLAKKVTTFDTFAGMSVHMAVPSTFP
jgi:hypothetical protein